MFKQTKQLQGFTLIEMLVVVAIIAILISILVPTLASARNQSRHAVCRTNLKSMGELIAAYAQENQNRIPRGPSFYEPNSLFDAYKATNAVWVGIPFPPIFENNSQSQYIGAGLLTKEPGKFGNEFMYCPADDQADLQEEGPKIGKEGELAFSSYFYRQLDLLPPLASGEYSTTPQRQQAGLLDALGSNYGERLAYNAASGSVEVQTAEVPVRALAIDANTRGTTADTRRSNHKSRKANVLYTDGSTNNFENAVQVHPTDPTIKRLWASVGQHAFGGNFPIPAELSAELDRIFMAADFSFRSDPTKAPWPNYTYP